MANIAGDYTGPLVDSNVGGTVERSKPAAVSLLGSSGAPPPTFKMRGRDNGRTPGSDYIIWSYTGTEPDFAGTGFTGGTPTPIGSLIVGSVVNLG